jgi:predicted RNA-binding Zn-ribbon protein involved in translation (DUF1610 family)
MPYPASNGASATAVHSLGAQLVERDMNCLVCGANAETIETTGNVVSLACPRCGEYDVSRSVIAAGQLRQLKPTQRRDILDKAKRSAALGARPLIRPYLLA